MEPSSTVRASSTLRSSPGNAMASANGSTSPARRADSATAGKEEDERLELKDMVAKGADGEPALPVEQDIIQLARFGEIGAIQKLFDTKEYDATYMDQDGNTLLHWAAINNQYALCHFLIMKGANVNARGGDAMATPLFWAAKKCNYYVVNLLLQHGANPLITDDSGYNLLHTATMDGNVFQIALLLHQDIPVDVQDRQGHTALMWAAYRGYGAVVDLLLRWGANVNARDEQGFTPLHWALVKGAQHPIFKIIEYGSDRFAENNEGKTPAVVAQEMKCTRQWKLALAECGYTKDGSPLNFPLSRVVKDRRTLYNRAFFIWPFFVGLCFIWILSHFIVYIGVPLAFLTVYLLQTGAQWTLRWAPTDMKTMHKVPFLAGVFAGTLFWLGFIWITRVLPWTLSSHFFLNILFGTAYGLCTYFYFKAMITDPGYIPKAGSRVQQKAVIDELLEQRKFDETNFCVTCMVRRPLRSKHCKKCGRCVAKQDHHCPWVDNCVAVNNHRHFVLYVLSLAAGVLLWDWLFLKYLEIIPPSTTTKCVLLSPNLCATLNSDPFSIVLTLWGSVQLVWVTMLLIVQIVQITRGLTTYEAMMHHRHGEATLPSENLSTFLTTGTTSLETAQLTPGNRGPDPGVQHPHPKHRVGYWAQFQTMLGIDTFLATALRTGPAGAGMPRERAKRNPFSKGWIQNFKDFWCDGQPVFGSRANGEALLGGERVDYTSLFDLEGLGLGARRRGGMEYVGVSTEDGEEV